MNASELKKIMRLCATAGVVLVLSACATRPAPPAGETSAVSERVATLVAANRKYPRWEDFPPTPTDLPQPIQIAGSVNTLRATGGALAGEASRIQWDLSDPAGFVADITARIDATKVSPITTTTQADVEDFARRLRERAIAPPPIDRR